MVIDVRYSREGDNIPHFHIYNENVKSKNGHKYFSAAIMIKDAAFFNHGKHKDLLTKKQVEYPIKFLNKVDKQTGETMLYKIIDAWNKSYPNSQIDRSLEIPNYEDIITYEEWKRENK